MSQWLTPAQLRSLERGFRKRVETPIPTQIVSSGECYPPPQSQRQAQVEALIGAGAEHYARRLGRRMCGIICFGGEFSRGGSSWERGSRYGLEIGRRAKQGQPGASLRASP